MKKILILGLAVLMIVMAIASCKTIGDDTESTPADSIPTASTPESTPGSTPESTPESTPAPQPEEVVFTDCDETVYVVGTEFGLKLRTATDFDDETNVAHYVDPNTELKRTGVHETWSRVEYEGKEYFTSSKYLSTEKASTETQPEVNVTFTPKNEKVYVKTNTEGGSANIYTKPSKSYPASGVALPTEGTELKRTGIAYDTPGDPEGLGWSRVEYNGQEYFMRNSVLSTEKPKTSETN